MSSDEFIAHLCRDIKTAASLWLCCHAVIECKSKYIKLQSNKIKYVNETAMRYVPKGSTYPFVQINRLQSPGLEFDG